MYIYNYNFCYYLDTLYETVEKCGLSAVKFTLDRGIPFNEKTARKDGKF